MIDHPGSSSSHSAMYVAVSTGQGHCRRHPVHREVIWSTPHASIKGAAYIVLCSDELQALGQEYQLL